MKVSAVVDTACLIGLERIGRLDILPALLAPILAPPSVLRELGQRPVWISESAPENQGTVAALRLLVDPGEAEAIALAYEKQIRIILDDLKGRKVAREMGIAVTGAVGLLVKAKAEGVVPALKPLLEALEASRFHIGRGLRAEALRLAGELM